MRRAAGLSINQPIRRWTDAIPEGSATLRHVLSHASSGVPGRGLPLRSGPLCHPDQRRRRLHRPPLPRRAVPRDLRPAGHAGFGARPRPGRQRHARSSALLGRPAERFGAVLGRLATPYRVDRSGKASRSEYPAEGVNAATGLVSTAQDLARFDAALDDQVLLRPELLSVAWSNVTTSSGAPAALGARLVRAELQRGTPGLALRRHPGRGLVAAHQGAAARHHAHPARQQRRPQPVVDLPRAMSPPRSSPSCSCESSSAEARSAPHSGATATHRRPAGGAGRTGSGAAPTSSSRPSSV